MVLHKCLPLAEIIDYLNDEPETFLEFFESHFGLNQKFQHETIVLKRKVYFFGQELITQFLKFNLKQLLFEETFLVSLIQFQNLYSNSFIVEKIKSSIEQDIINHCLLLLEIVEHLYSQ